MRRYSVQVNNVAVSAAKDIMVITAPSTMVLVVLRAWISQTGSVTSEQNRAMLSRASTANAGTSETPAKLESGDPAATFTAISLSGSDNTLTGDPIVDEGFNLVSGYLWVPAPEERLWIPPSGNLVLRMGIAPSASKNVSAGLIVGEVG